LVRRVGRTGEKPGYISLPIHGAKTGSSDRSQAKLQRAARGYRQLEGQQGTAPQARQGGELSGNYRACGRFESGLVFDQKQRAAGFRERGDVIESLMRSAARAQRKDVQPEWVMHDFGTLLLASKQQQHPRTTCPDHRPDQLLRVPARSKFWNFASGWALCNTGRCWAISCGGLRRGFRTRKRLFSL